MARRGYPPEFRRRVVDLVEGGRKVSEIASEVGVSGQTIYVWRRQARIEAGLPHAASCAGADRRSSQTREQGIPRPRTGKSVRRSGIMATIVAPSGQGSWRAILVPETVASTRSQCRMSIENEQLPGPDVASIDRLRTVLPPRWDRGRPARCAASTSRRRPEDFRTRQGPVHL